MSKWMFEANEHYFSFSMSHFALLLTYVPYFVKDDNMHVSFVSECLEFLYV